MSFALPLRLARSRYLRFFALGLLLMAGAVVISKVHRKPRAWRVNEVPVAFWAWRNQTPDGGEVRAAIASTGARAIFLRAGQIDLASGKLSRIRAVNGPL